MTGHNFSADEVSCRQGKDSPCCEFALMTTPSFPFAIGQAGTPAGMRTSTKDSAINVVLAEQDSSGHWAYLDFG